MEILALIDSCSADEQPVPDWCTKVLCCALSRSCVEILALIDRFFNYFFQGSPCILESRGFFFENSRTWKVLEKHFGPGKYWKISLKVMHFSSDSNGKQAAIV